MKVLRLWKACFAFLLLLLLDNCSGQEHAHHRTFLDEEPSTAANHDKNEQQPLRNNRPMMDYHIPMMTPSTAETSIPGLFEFCNLFGNNLCRHVLDWILFKPPVGIVIIVAGIRLIQSGRIISWLLEGSITNGADEEDDVQEPPAVSIHKSKKGKRQHRGRASQLDPDDTKYVRFGSGVDRIRRALCAVALEDIITSGDDKDANDELVEAVQEALKIPTDSTATRPDWLLLHHWILPLSRIQAKLAKTDLSASLWGRKQPRQKKRTKSISTPSEQRTRVLAIAVTSLQIQALDALLRVARDRLLKAASRLAKEEAYWQRRVTAWRKKQWWRHVLVVSSRRDPPSQRLAYAQAAYHAELYRLGRLTAVLLDRPPDLSDKVLLQVKMMMTKQDGTRSKASSLSTAAALQTMKAAEDNNDGWQEQADDWMNHARQVLCETVKDTLDHCRFSQDCTPPPTFWHYPTPSLSRQEFETLEAAWRQQWEKNPISRECATSEANVAAAWTQMLHYIDSLAGLCRVGETRRSSVRLQDAIRRWWLWSRRRLDVAGIPSYLLQIWLAHQLHHQILLPYWPLCRERGKQAARAAAEIVRTRAWIPLKGIVDDIMNRNEGMMSAFSLHEEERVLDHMLKAAGFGDGTPATRAQAVEAATQQYETDFVASSFFVVHVASGRLVRLLLVQCQQLKVGLLSALDTIDVLMKGNRIHFQILAGIPAVWMVTYGTRLFLRALYNIRAKDLRPVHAIHADMALYLEKMEALLVRVAAGREGEERPRLLSSAHLGEFLLFLHRYLVLLDYGAPLFASRDCDQIHSSLQELIVTASRSHRHPSSESHASDQMPRYVWELEALRLIRSKHHLLAKQF